MSFCQIRIGSAVRKEPTGDKLCQNDSYNITGKDLGATSLYSLTCLFLTWSSCWEFGKYFDEETQYRHVVSV